MKKKSLRIIGVTSFVIGILILFYLSVMMVWAEIEATFFNAMFKSDEPLAGLSCPAFITTNEIAEVTGRFENTFEKTVNMEIRTYVTDGFVTLMTEYISNFTLEPGQTEFVNVQVTADEAAYDRFVMVRMHQMKRNPFPYQNASCGIVVVGVPFLTGSQFLVLMIALGTLFSLGGIIFWAVNAKPAVRERLKALQAMIFLLIITIALLVTSLLNSWFIGIIILVVWILMAVGMVWQFSMTERKKDFEEIKKIDAMDQSDLWE